MSKYKLSCQFLLFIRVTQFQHEASIWAIALQKIKPVDPHDGLLENDWSLLVNWSVWALNVDLDHSNSPIVKDIDIEYMHNCNYLQLNTLTMPHAHQPFNRN